MSRTLETIFSSVVLVAWLTKDIRYDRVKAVQKTGEANRDMWHKADWDEVEKDPTLIQLPREDWIMMHDAETHAEEVFDEVAMQVK